ncbi:MAG: acetyl-CoA C-acetyltransferase [Myxococcota bacterium]|nr:acetyl-CoA C-acetyltransferase [Myxococcota bacterium]
MTDVVILGAKRTPVGSFLGSLASVAAPRLGAAAIEAVLSQSGVAADQVEQVLFGNVLQAGLGQAPARQAAIYGGLPASVGAVTLHKVCGSGLRAVMDGANAIKAGEWSVVIAGGMESMSNSPHILPNSRGGYRMGNVQAVDTMVHDGLWDPYGDKHMGSCAELCATRYGFTREEQDAFALTSYTRARASVEGGLFKDEIAPVNVPQRRGDPIVVDTDEEPFKAPLEKMPTLRPAFDKAGTITAANASKINDGAAALLLASKEQAADSGWTPLGRIVSYASHAQEPEWFTTAPVEAARKALDKAGLSAGEIDQWEVNEAFAVVTMASIRDLELDPERVNKRGGSVAIGHPIGASGARILTTLLHTLLAEKQRYGCASICIGGGEAAAVVIENLTL